MQAAKLGENMDTNTAFKRIVWECLKQLQGNQEIVLHVTDVEGVHQMRVALRRLRAAFSLFHKVLGRENIVTLLEEVDWLADTLGKARDIDVFVTQTLPAVTADFKNHTGLRKLHNKALNAQIAAYKDVRAALSSRRFQRLQQTLANWLENEGWRKNTQNPKHNNVLDIAITALDHRYHQLRQCGKHLTQMRPKRRHAVRIAAKKLRYTAEFFTNLYPSAKSRPFIRNLSQLQNHLGILNDIATIEKLLHQLLGSSADKSLNEAQHIIVGWNAYISICSLENTDVAWKAFISKKPFWR
jgi:CHAD domain-containing protein